MAVVPAALGIDFGSSHTVAVLRRDDGRVEPLLFDASPLLPSAVFADPDGRVLVGRDAVYASRLAPECLEPHPKRRIDDGSVLLGEREFAVTDLFAAALERVRRECVQVAGMMPAEVVVTHPAVWGPRRRLVLSQACTKAGLGPVRLVPEPVAAATYLTEQLHHNVDENAAVVVHDFGGGTFDAAVVCRTGDGFEVLSVDGLDNVGGIDIDAAIITHLRDRIGEAESWQHVLSPDTVQRRRAWRTFTDDVRTVKEQLSRQSSADIYIPVMDTDVHLTRTEVEDLARPLVCQAIDVVHAVIADANLSGTPEVFLVGGASRMPLVATLLHQQLQTPPIVTDQLEQIVAHGALLTGPPPTTPRLGLDEHRTTSDEHHSQAARTTTITESTVRPRVTAKRAASPHHISGSFGSKPATVALAGHSAPVGSVAFSPDGASLASISGDFTIRLWDIATHTCSSVIPVPEDRRSPRVRKASTHNGCLVLSVAYSPDGRLLASTAADNTIRIWDVATRSPAAILTGHTSTVRSVAFGPNGLLASISSDGTVRLWDVATEATTAVFTGHTIVKPNNLGARYSVTISPDGKLLASADTGRTGGVRLWDVDTGAETATNLNGPVSLVLFSPDGTKLAALSNRLILWDVPHRATISRIYTLGWAAAFSPDGQAVAICREKVDVHDVATGTRLGRLTPGTLFSFFMGEWLYSVAFSHDGRLIAGGSDRKSVTLWHLDQ